MEISPCFPPCFSEVITMNFCTCHDSFAVMACAKFCSDMIIPYSGVRPLLWPHYEHDVVSNCQPHDCLLKCLFRRRSKETSKLRLTGLCEGNSPGTGEFPAQRASNAENVSIWWRHHINPIFHRVWITMEKFVCEMGPRSYFTCWHLFIHHKTYVDLYNTFPILT